MPEVPENLKLGAVTKYVSMLFEPLGFQVKAVTGLPVIPANAGIQLLTGHNGLSGFRLTPE